MKLLRELLHEAVKTAQLSDVATQALEKLVARHALEGMPKFKNDDGWLRLMNSSLLVDERSDEGASRKSAIAGALQSAGYEVDWKSNIFRTRLKKPT